MRVDLLIYTIRLFVIFFISFFLSLNVRAEITLTESLAKDISSSYGYYLGQHYSINEITKKYPQLSRQALIAENEFLITFETSLKNMDVLMTKQLGIEWEQIKTKIIKAIPEKIDLSQLTESESTQFIELVKFRAKGEIESPILETLLLFKKGYREHPEKEFLDGFKYRYENDGYGKARGISFSLELPQTWINKEGNRPHIVQKFISKNGGGFATIMVIINDLPLKSDESLSEKDISEILSSNEIYDFVPDGFSYINSGKLSIEGLPGLWIQCKGVISRARSSINSEIIQFNLFFKDKLFQIHAQVPTHANNKALPGETFIKYERLFDLVANSLVIKNLYENKPSKKPSIKNRYLIPIKY